MKIYLVNAAEVWKNHFLLLDVQARLDGFIEKKVKIFIKIKSGTAMLSCEGENLPVSIYQSIYLEYS